MPVKMIWHGATVSAAVKAESRQSLYEAAEVILEEANRKVPHDEGTLEKSGEVSAGEIAGQNVAVILYDTPYAVKLHEHPEYNFQKGRTGKWLENALKQFAGKFEVFLAGKFKRLF